MPEAIIGKKYIFLDNKMGTGAVVDPADSRDLQYGEIALGAAPIDWEKGYDVEKELGIKIKIKNQNGSSSCVGQGWAYQTAVLDAAETGYYSEISAKAFYSQMYLPGGGAYIRDGARLAVNFGALPEMLVPTYDNGKPPSEEFCRGKEWLNPKTIELAKRLQAKEYRTFGSSMDILATAIRDNFGAVGGVNGENNGTWSSNEPKPPKNPTWAHCLYFGKFGKDSLGKFIATPNSWGTRGTDILHPDGWQKLREDWFTSGNMFNPWTLVDKPNFSPSLEALEFVKKYEKRLVIEGEGVGRKGVVIDGVLRGISDPSNNRATAASLYVMANNDLGVTISTKLYNELPKGNNF